MNLENYEEPKTLEEAQAKKQELLKKINAYNEAIFNEQDPPYTDEEMDLFQEEYELLDSKLKLTEEEKLALLSSEDVEVLEDGTKVRKVSKFDNVSTLSIVLSIILILFAGFVCVYSLVSNHVMENYIHKVFAKAYEANVGAGAFAESEYFIKPFAYYFRFAMSYYLLPLIALALLIVYFVSFKKKNKIYALVILVVCVLAMFTCATIAFINEFDLIKGIYDEFGAEYDYYSYIQMYSSLSGY